MKHFRTRNIPSRRGSSPGECEKCHAARIKNVFRLVTRHSYAFQENLLSDMGRDRRCCNSRAMRPLQQAKLFVIEKGRNKLAARPRATVAARTACLAPLDHPHPVVHGRLLHILALASTGWTRRLLPTREFGTGNLDIC
jgi:hypothetical protein